MIPTHLLPLLGAILGAGPSPAGQGDGPQRPRIRKLGTLDPDMVEATPVGFKDRLDRFEYVRKDYQANTAGDSYFRFVDVATGEPTPAFARGYDLGCAYAEGGSMRAFGVDQWDGSKVVAFRSDDLKSWESHEALDLASKVDRRIANPKLNDEQRTKIAGAVDRNNSDIDFCEFRGQTVITDSWGNQPGTELLAGAVHDGSLASFLKGYFP